MRILHTADWHFGKTLEGRSRQQEQEQFVEELCDICDREQVNLVLVAGDIFQQVNPSAAAEELYYYAIERLSANGQRGVVIIAGNHDNPERLAAASPLAERHGITLIGRPKDEILTSSEFITNRVRRVNAGSSWLELEIPGCDHNAIIAALPYPSEERLRELLAQTTDELELLQNYNERIECMFRELASNYRPDTVNLAMSHLFVRGGIMSDSELQIQVGGAYAVHPSAFPDSAQYVALGHLHRPQIVHASPAPTRYSGSPLAYSFSEAGQQKVVVLIDVIPGQPAEIQEIPLTSGRPLVKWKAVEGLEQVHRWVDEGRDEHAWIDLEVHTTEPFRLETVQMLRSMPRDFVDIRNVLPDLENPTDLEEQKSLPIDQMFTRFYERKLGAPPNEEMLQLFLELTQDLEEEQEIQETSGEEIAG